VFSQIAFSSARWRWSPSRRLCGARLRRPAGGRDLRLLKAGEMLDGLGMAETPSADHGAAVRGFMAAFRDAAACPRCLAAGRLLATGSRSPSSWIFSVRRSSRCCAQRGGERRCRHHRCVVGVILNLAVWFAWHTVFRDVAPVRLRVAFDAPVLAVRSWASRSRSRRSSRSSLQVRDAHDARRMTASLHFSHLLGPSGDTRSIFRRGISAGCWPVHHCISIRTMA